MGAGMRIKPEIFIGQPKAVAERLRRNSGGGRVMARQLGGNRR
jgi:hypothetical protein